MIGSIAGPSHSDVESSLGGFIFPHLSQRNMNKVLITKTPVLYSTKRSSTSNTTNPHGIAKNITSQPYFSQILAQMRHNVLGDDPWTPLRTVSVDIFLSFQNKFCKIFCPEQVRKLTHFLAAGQIQTIKHTSMLFEDPFT